MNRTLIIARLRFVCWPGGVLLGLLLAGAARAQAPAVTSVAPARNAVAALRTAPVAVTFSQALANSAATRGALKVFSQQAGGLKTGAATASGNTLSFQPTTAFQAGETVSATLTAGAQSSTGAVARPQVFQFTAATTPSPGVFGGGSDVVVGTKPSSVAVGDVDGDGDLDLLILKPDSATVTVRLNQGRNTFSDGQRVPIRGSAQLAQLTVGDFDGDGDLDFLVVGSWLFSTASIELNNGDGTFRDGRFLGNTAGGIGPNVGRVIPGDVDGDGDLDLLMLAEQPGRSGTIIVLLNNGNADFNEKVRVSVNLFPQLRGAGDVDGDGDLDFVAAGFSLFLNAPTANVYLNDGTGSFSVGRQLPPDSHTLADLNGDSYLDLVSGSNLLLNDGTGTFTSTADGRLGSFAGQVGDADGDGDLDFISSLGVAFNDGTGRFARGPAAGTPASGPLDGPLADLDGDGTLDVISFNQNRDTLSVRLNKATPPTSAAYRLHAGSGALATSRGLFAADQYYSATSAEAATTAPVAGTPDPALYQTERYSTHGTLAYALPLANGPYTVVLHFAEIYWTQPGQRVFDAALEGTKVLDHYDIVKKVGPLTATTETFTVTVTDGVLNLDLSVPYLSGGADQAKLSALEVLPVLPAATRLRAGGGALATTRGAFAADQYYSAASAAAATAAPIAGTSDPALYQTERYGTNGTLSYALPVANGPYTVVLHFAEIYWTQPGQRVFDAALEGTKVLDHYDIVKKVGPLTATTETFPVTVTDGVLNLDLSVPYLRGGMDQPKISAIEVLNGGPTQAASRGALASAAAKGEAPLAVGVYPNPSAGRFTLVCTASVAQAATLLLTDQLGRVVQQQRVQLQTGPNALAVLADGATPGLYQLVLRTADGKSQRQKVLIQP